MKSKYICYALLLFSFHACSEYSPKPKAYPRVQRSLNDTCVYKGEFFSFKYLPDISIQLVQAIKSYNGERYWYNMYYKKFDVIVYCSYFNLEDKEELFGMFEDNDKFIHNPTTQGSEILMSMYENKESNLYGAIYSFSTPAVTPLQFYITDSVTHFMRGSMYYNSNVNADSVLPITKSITKDVQLLIESLQWMQKK